METIAKKGFGIANILFLILSIVTLISVVIFACLLISTVIADNGYTKSKLVLYDGPKTMKSSKTSVKVDGQNLFVYDTAVNNGHTWAADGNPPLTTTPITYFDMNGKVKVDVTIPNIDIKTCTISPLSDGITPIIKDHTVTFDIGKPGDYTLQFNDSVVNAVHIFANPIETNVPTKSSTNLVYIGPGEWNIDNIPLKSGETLYISGGAVIHGTISANLAQNVTVRGRGIIDGDNYEGWMLPGQTARVPISFINCSNINVEGIIFLDPNAWTFNSYDSQNATIKNIKVISARPNGDGITLQSCQNFTVSDCFVRSWDDSLVVKNYDENSYNITFENMQIWTDYAQSCEIGYETNKGNKPNPSISNITFKNITVINNFHKPVISIHNSDNALISNILYDNITVENAQMGDGDAGTNDQLIDFEILTSQWSTTPEKGNIRDVTVENVNVLKGKFPPSSILGYDSTHTIEDVTIKNLTILGKKITSLSEGQFFTNYTKNITFK
jgi:hypothetical protein